MHIDNTSTKSFDEYKIVMNVTYSKSTAENG